MSNYTENDNTALEAVLIEEYSKTSMLFHEVMARIENGGKTLLAVEGEDILTVDYIQDALQDSGRRVNKAILDAIEAKMDDDREE